MTGIEVRRPIVSSEVTSSSSGRLANRQRYQTVVQHQQGASRHMPNHWQPGVSGNPAGRPRGSRNKLTEAVVCALLRDFSKHGEKAIARVRRDQPGTYLKCLCLLLPRQDKLEHANTIKSMTDAELESAIAILNEMVALKRLGART